MNKSMKAGALLIAGVFALSGCGGSGDSAEAAADSSATAEAASPTPTPTPTPAVGREQYTPDELEAALTAVKEDQGLPGQIANDAAVRPELEGVEGALDTITITPEECSDLASANLGEKIDSSTVAIMQLSATDALTVISFEDAELIDEQVANNDQQMVDCSTFQMETQGQVFTASAEEVDASTDAVTTQAYSVTIDMAGQQTTTLQISGFAGTTNITVSMSDPVDPAGAQAEAEKLIDAVLAELEE
ncbi:hypothetical protein OL239_14155 [Arthrobacter sp. ATA002]|uniref:hypothetical protein n=1 Tax=Arthrobacter sp. ATA002 TaxID=2991715 RepID=UPI0022A6F1EE|nr:hypothetical protein [Arthrobacter sp. ATA002]WAP51044.1 hypothetical protein OL239_14155 [Arthrobacter sp. ATA002]